MRAGRAASILIALGWLCFLSPGGLGSAGAQEATRLAVIDIQRIMRDSTAAVGLREVIEVRRTSYQNEIADRESQLRAKEQELAKQRNVLSPDHFQERQREFQNQVAELGRLVEARKRQINQAMNDAMQRIQGALGQVIEEIVAERELTLVLPRSQVVFSDESLDVTDVVLQRLNERMPDVQVALPEE